MTRVLAIVAAPTLESPAGTEFLRVLTALRATGAEVRVVETGPGLGALTVGDPALELEGERYLAALGEEGVVAHRGGDLGADVVAADALVVFPDPARKGEPPLLVLPGGVRPSEGVLENMLQAGQITLGSDFPST